MEVEFTKRWEQGAGGLVGGTEDVEGARVVRSSMETVEVQSSAGMGILESKV